MRRARFLIAGLHTVCRGALIAVGLLSLNREARGGDVVTFDRDVMAVLSKAGCNLGACHDNQEGKGGFKLSLRGEDPAADHVALLRQADQRRVNLLDPDTS